MAWMRFRLVYLLISGAALALSVYAIVVWGFRLSIDFTGGSSLEARFEKQTSTEHALQLARGVQSNPQSATQMGDRVIQFRFGPEFDQTLANALVLDLQRETDGSVELVRFETVGPVLSQEILKKTYVGVSLAAVGILLLIAWQFRDIRLGVTAIFAVIHDLVILFGIFAYLGKFHAVELDVLFITAVLMVFALSLYDTIVVYDRIRESTQRMSSAPLLERANKAISETIVRSINTSMTTSFVLFALFLMGGATIKWFALALLVGILSGTYSSPFVAVPLLVTWDEWKKGVRGEVQTD